MYQKKIIKIEDSFLMLHSFFQLLESFTRGMVDEYYNLNIAQQIKHYSGPLLVVRRELDEMMSM